MLDTKTQAPIACDLTAIPKGERDGHIATAKHILSSVTYVREQEDGYALRLSNETVSLQDVVRYIAHERKCCPFFHFVVEIEADGGPLWLELAGREGVKDFLRGEISGQLDPEVARRANLL